MRAEALSGLPNSTFRGIKGTLAASATGFLLSAAIAKPHAARLASPTTATPHEAKRAHMHGPPRDFLSGGSIPGANISYLAANRQETAAPRERKSRLRRCLARVDPVC